MTLENAVAAAIRATLEPEGLDPDRAAIAAIAALRAYEGEPLRNLLGVLARHREEWSHIESAAQALDSVMQSPEGLAALAALR